MSSKYLSVFLLLALHLAGQVVFAAPPEFICEVFIPDIGCTRSFDMNSVSYYEDETEGNDIVYTLKAIDPADNSTDMLYEIIPTEQSNLPTDINPANGFDYMTVDTTGNVTFKVPMDYEEYTQVRPTWKVTSLSTGGVTIKLAIVTILNVNDINPKFINQPYISEPIPENTTVGTTVYSNVNATDDDAPGVDGPIAYYLTSDYSNFNCEVDKFRIDPVSGEVILDGELNYLGQTQYTVCIEANDQGDATKGGPLSAYTTVRLSVLDVQGEKPNFVGIPYRDSVAEDTSVNTIVFAPILANDGDTGVPNPNSVSFTLSEGFGKFEIRQPFANQAEIILVQELDRETNDTFTLLIEAREDDTTQKEENIVETTTIEITVSDVNDEAPVFYSDDLVYAFLQENSPTNTPLNLDITVEDIDSAPNAEFTLSLDGAEGAFKLQQSVIKSIGTVDIRVNNSNLLDYETRKYFNFSVIASEVGHANVAIQVSVELLDVNDNSPQFNQSEYNCAVLENSVTGTSVCQVTATDEDSPEFAAIKYSLEGSGSDRFEIDEMSGIITVNTDNPKQDLNAETQRLFFLTILADDGDRVATALLQIELEDVNDESPEFNPKDQQITIEEFDDPGRIGELLVTVSATDRDILEENQILTYSIYEGNEDGEFSIDSTSGEIRLNDTIDYEELNVTKEYVLVVLAINTAEPYLSGNTTVTVTILDINDNAPVFEERLYTVNVSEDASLDTSVITLTATDDDEPGRPNSNIDYRILSGSQDKFRIIVNTGEIRVNDELNRESVQNYTLVVVATDRGIIQLSGNCTVFVKITDVNDVPPTFEDIQSQNIPENYTTGPSSVFYTVTAIDPDDTADLSYFIDSENILVANEDGEELDNSQFTDQFGIVEATGGLYVNQSLDRETAATFVLPLIVVDNNAQNSEPEEQMDERELTITVEDVNDNAPTFKDLPYEFSVEEHEGEGTVISPSISATDPDFGSNGIVRYSTVNGSGSGFEYVEINPETGVLTATGDPEFDREVHAVLYVVVRASDTGTPPNHMDTTVTLNITDINDRPPVFNSTIPAEISIEEDLAVGSMVLKVTATDEDTDHAVITYAITAGNNDKYFDIDPTTGIIRVNKILDRESIAVYVLTITASDKPEDQQPQQDVIELAVQILDVNDMTPVITSTEFDTGERILESEPVGSNILNVLAVDGDQQNTNNSDFYFFVGGGTGADLFGIDPKGAITVISSLQSLSAEYTLIVVVRDRGEPPLQSNRTLVIDVEDVNDDTPRILYPEDGEDVFVDEDFGPGLLLTINAEDLDEGDNGKITYEFVTIGGKDYERFTLNNATGNLTINEVTDRETKDVYELIIQVANRFSLEERVSAPVSFQVRVNDKDDNEPIFREPSTLPEPVLLSVGENMDVGTLVGNVDVASDKDGPGNDEIFYFIIGGNEANLFFLDKTTGDITTTTILDREAVPQYTLIVKASSNPDYLPEVQDVATSLNELADNETEVVISVTDDNDNGPRFIEELFTAGVLSNQVLGYIVQAEAVDLDTSANSQTEFFLDGELNCITECQQVKETFGINKTDGWIYTTRLFEDSDQGYFELAVRVMDPTKPNDQNYVDTATVNIYLITDQEQVRINFGAPQEEVRGFERDFRIFYASVVEDLNEAYTDVAINVDDLQVDTDIVAAADPPSTSNRTYMIIHGVDSDTNRVIAASILVSAFDESSPQQKDIFFDRYAVRAVNLVVPPPPEPAFDEIEWIFFGVALACLFLLVIMLVGFLFSRNDYRRKLRAAEAGTFTTNSKPVNPTLIPGTNKFAAEASNPIFNEKKSPYTEIEEEDTEEGESANSMEDNEEQEVTVDMYNDDDDREKMSTDSAVNSNKLLLAVLEELDMGTTEKYGLDNIDVTDV